MRTDNQAFDAPSAIGETFVGLVDGVYDDVRVEGGQIVSAHGPLPVCDECGAIIRGPLSHVWTCPNDITEETERAARGQGESATDTKEPER